MKKYLLSLFIVFSGALVFAGGQQQRPAEPQGPVTIRYAFWGNPDAIGVEQEIIDAFEAANPDIKVEPVVSGYGDYHTQLFTLIAGGSTPDVMRIDSYYIEDFVKADVLHPLDNLIQEAGIDLDDYYTQGIVENQFNGVTYGLPWGTAPLFYFLNIDTFEKYGIPLPSIDWSMDDFEEILRAFEPIPDVYGFAMTLAGLSGFYPYMWAEGGDIFDESRSRFALNQPESYRAIQKVADWYKEGLLPPEMITADGPTTERWFLNGNAAVIMGSANTILSFQRTDARFEAWPMPTGITPQTTIVKSNTIGIAESSQQKEAAWRFVEFLRGPGQPGEELYMRAKRIPPTIRGEQYWSLYADPTRYPRRIQEVAEAISSTYGRGMLIRAGFFEVEQLVLPELQRIFLGEITAQQAMQRIAPEAQRILDR